MTEINERIERIESARRKRRLQRVLFIALAILIFAGAVIGGVTYSKKRQANLPGMFSPSVGAEHMPLAGIPKTPYSSNPPSSGSHFSYPANWGVYDYEVNDQIFLHNLEHGGVWIAYKPTVASSTVQTLKGIVDSFGGSKWIMAPRAANDADIAVVAWTRVLSINLAGSKLSDEQKKEIEEFYKAFKNKGPEYIPDTAPGIDPREAK